MNLGIDAAKNSAKRKSTCVEHLHAELEAVYARRPFRTLPREATENFIRDMVDLLSA